MKGRLAVLGAGGHGKVVADCAECLDWSEIHLFDDGQPPPGHWPLAGASRVLFDDPAAFAGVVVGIGSNSARLALSNRLVEAGGRLATLIHPRSFVSRHAGIGAGSVVLAGAVVNVDARIGAAAIINTGATVDHDCRLDDGVHISPGARLAGGVTVGEGSWIGIGAVILEGVAIGRNAIIGAGAVVIRPVADGQVVIGNPARLLER